MWLFDSDINSKNMILKISSKKIVIVDEKNTI